VDLTGTVRTDIREGTNREEQCSWLGGGDQLHGGGNDTVQSRDIPTLEDTVSWHGHRHRLR
jgi:hypothetical protein